MDTGRVIQRRYLLQRLITRGAACAVYQGFDQVLQRSVAVKVTPVEHISAYRAAIRATSQFAHPNIIGLYDLIIEPECLYIMQEYVEGEDFGALLRAQLPPFQVVDLGMQICQALLYASTPSRKVCHGDLTPAALIRDRRGQVRLNNFALPPDMHYFTAWSVVGGSNLALAESELPYGQISDARRADDTRAVGLLLYQLLCGRSADATFVEPPADGRLRFLRNVPPELCELVARTIVRMHPQHITTPETLLTALKALSETLEPVVAPVPEKAAYALDDMPRVTPYAPSPSGRLSASGPLRENTTAEEVMPRRATSARMAAMEAAPAPTIADVSIKLAAARQAAYSNVPDAQVAPHRINVPLLLMFGFVLFAVFFGVGYWLAHVFLP